MTKSNLLILERSLSEIAINEEAKTKGEYILEGIFSEIGVKNKNNRIYDEAEFVPHINELAKLVSAKRVLGELDHPKQFEISLKNVSHVIEEISYDEKSKQVRGKIKLLDTEDGRKAKALVDAGVPLHISSRAAGVVEGNGHVKIKKLFTYDLVADPGFENAQLNRVNESFGIENDSNIQIFELDESFEKFESETKPNNMEKTNESKFMTVEDFNEYTKIIKGEFTSLKEKLNGITENLNNSTADVKPNGELVKYIEEIANTVNDLTNTVSMTVENVDNLISHNDYVIEGLEKVKDYAELIALKTDQGIEYTKKVAESVDNTIEYTKIIAETVDNSIEYTKVLAENLDNSISYTEATNEHLDHLTEYTKHIVETVDTRMSYQDEINEATDNLISHNDYIIENLSGISKYQDFLKENIQTLSEYTESIVATINENVVDEITNTTKKEEVKESKFQKLTESVNALELGSMDDFKSSILEKLNTLTESAKKQKAVEESKELNFLNFLSESKRAEFEALEEAKKFDVIKSFNDNKYFGSRDVERIYESNFVDNTPIIESWITNIPAKIKPLWEALNENRKAEIKAQASISNLTTQYQIDHFWSTRDLRNVVINLNESRVHASDSKLDESNNTDDKMALYGAAIAKRFGR